MKKICLLSIALFLACAVNAQTTFTVPTPTMEEKAGMNKVLMNNNILALITVAKNEGITAEDLGKKSGEIFCPAWDENGGYEPFINFILYSWVCLTDSVKIIEQTNEKLVVMVSSLYHPLEEQGTLFGTSVEDYTAFFNAMLNKIAVHLGHSLEMTRGEKGYKLVFTLQ
jgi:hypothetical protein